MPCLLMQHLLSRELARIGIERAVVASAELGCRTCVAIVDTAGHLVPYDRMHGAPFRSARHAQDKAIASAGNGMATDEFWAYARDDAQLRLGVLKLAGLSILRGGVPIRVNGELVGAVGVSGGCGMAEDRAIAEEAVAAVLAALASQRTGKEL